MASQSFWDRRENIKTKPSVELRTLRVIDYIMEDEGLPIGVTIEKLMRSPGLYEEIVKKLAEVYPDISAAS